MLPDVERRVRLSLLVEKEAEELSSLDWREICFGCVAMLYGTCTTSLFCVGGQSISRASGGEHVQSHGALAALPASVLCLSGCQQEMLSDGRIASDTAIVIGTRPDQLAITDRLSNRTNTYYDAHTGSGAKYPCVISSGGPLAAGMTDQPSCKQTRRVLGDWGGIP